LPFFFDHYEEVVDRFYMYDNFSNDSTRKLIKDNPKAKLINLFSWGKFNEKVLTKCRNTGWKRSKGIADFVIVCDVDELLHHQDLIGYIKGLQENKNTIAQVSGNQMVSTIFPELNIPITTQINTGFADDRFDKLVLFDPNEISAMNYGYGSHTAEPRGNVSFSTEAIQLLHYSFIGIEEKWQRMHQNADRYSQRNKKHQLGIHYTWSKERLVQEFNEMIEKSNPII
jgi:glycosyltransferase involved in cell wall biosynthesis